MPVQPDSNPIVISRAELLWLTAGTWLGGVCLLTVLPLLLFPRLGTAAGTAMSYVVFFLIWQAVQGITQRVLGAGAALIRMLALVGSAALIAYYLRDALVTASRM